jgi:UDP-N-acetylglucosamine--N-acetylmuramyl-(pentapeptide) pyrophosphoryl-undecaprenol N-acetylglucosamine transferase
MAGGTGGHVFPGLAVADYLHAHGWRVVWMGNPRAWRRSWCRRAATRWPGCALPRCAARGCCASCCCRLNLLRAFWQALRELGRVRPNVVLGMGGYVTFPGGMMAALTGRPLVVHEQNSVAGLANRVLAGVADRVLSGFPNVLGQGEWTGNPVRAEIAALPQPAQRYAGRSGPLDVLVVGGSLGAQALNDAVPRALTLITADERPRVTHQSGAKQIDALRAAYAVAGVEAELLPFIDDMAARYAQADLVICRAGALTVAELAAAGVASVLVPFPHAVDDHQTGNARFLSEAGAAILLPQKELTPEKLAALLAN